MRALVVSAFFLALLVASCDCESNCDREYQDCRADPDIGDIECDIGYRQCLDSCSTAATGAPDGG